MHKILEKLPKNLAAYLQKLMVDEGFDTDNTSRERFLKGWLKKRALFDKIAEHNGFVLIDRIEEDFRAGVLVFSYSGSLLTISAQQEDGTRDVLYESINLRQDKFPKIEEQSIKVKFPIELNQPVLAEGKRIVKTSPVFAIAIEAEAGKPVSEARKRFRMIGERIARGLLIINQAIFEKHSIASELENREDLFNQWIILTWFRIGGWEEEVFLARAQLLWLELFSQAFNTLKKKIADPLECDQAFLEIVNAKFSHFCDVYKWIESEKKTSDIGLMRALEELPLKEEYQAFINRELE